MSDKEKAKELCSESDESDEEFIPGNEPGDSDAPSEDSSDVTSEEEEEDAEEVEEKERKTSKRGKKPRKANGKQIKNTAAAVSERRQTRRGTNLSNGPNANEAENDDTNDSDEDVEDKLRSDALWADFIGAAAAAPKRENITAKDKTPVRRAEETIKPTISTTSDKPEVKEKTTITEIFKFAGETIEVKKDIDADATTLAKTNSSALPANNERKRASTGAGISSFVGNLNKKKKLSVLEKSQLDWSSFKQETGIEEQLQTHNKGKEGYIERQNFLQRTDLRQFEIERNLRQSRRKNLPN